MKTAKKVAIVVIIILIIGALVYSISVIVPTMYEPEIVKVADDNVIPETNAPVREPAKAFVMETISEDKAVTVDENLTFISREEKAEDSLPYYLKDFTFTRKSKKDIVIAKPDIQQFKELTSDKIGGANVYDLCVTLFPNSCEQVLQLCTAFIRKDTSSNDFVKDVLLAYTVSDKVKGISYIEYVDGIMTCYDADKKKLTVDVATGIVKNGSKEVAIDANNIIDISKKLETDYGFILDEERDRRAAVAEKEAEQAKKDAEKLQKEQEEAISQQQKEMAKVLKSNTHPFTDKNGTSTSFTNEEWTKLKSVWDYTGDGESYIGHHTVAELRQLLAKLP